MSRPNFLPLALSLLNFQLYPCSVSMIPNILIKYDKDTELFGLYRGEHLCIWKQLDSFKKKKNQQPTKQKTLYLSVWYYSTETRSESSVPLSEFDKYIPLRREGIVTQNSHSYIWSTFIFIICGRPDKQVHLECSGTGWFTS